MWKNLLHNFHNIWKLISNFWRGADGNESRIKILKKINTVSCFAVDAALHRGVEKSKGGPVRARLDLFGRLLARNFSRQTRRPASWRRLRNTSNPTRTHTHTHTHTRALRERERIERGWCANKLPFPSPFRVFRSANKGSNSVDFRTCFSITNPREAAAAAGKEEKNGRETRGSG